MSSRYRKNEAFIIYLEDVDGNILRFDSVEAKLRSTLPEFHEDMIDFDAFLDNPVHPRRQTAAEKHQALWDREQNKNILDSSIDYSKSSRNRITTPKQTTPDKQPRSPDRTVDAEKRTRGSLKRQETSRKLLDFDEFDDQRTFKKTDIFGRHTTLNDSLIKEQAMCGEYSKMLSNPLFANLYNNLF